MMYLAMILFRRRSAVLIVLLAFAVVSLPLRAGEVVVNCNGGDDLQTTIDAAVDGDVLTIKGTCLGPFLIDGSTANDLTLEGTRNATLDGNGAGPVVTVVERRVVFAHLTIKGGVASDFFAVAGLNLISSAVMLVETSVTGNHAESGILAVGGIHADSTELTIINSQVTRNTAVTEGTDTALAYGGILSEFGSTLTIDDSIIQDNHASAMATVEGAFAEAVGGIEQIFSGSATITDSRVDGNSGAGFAPDSGFGAGDGGILAIETAVITIINNRVLNNEATGSHLAVGGMEFFRAGPVTLHDSKLTGNIADAPAAIGGIEINITGATTITDSKVERNVALGDFAVGGIDVVSDSDVVTLEDSKVKNNLPIDCFGLLCE